MITSGIAGRPTGSVRINPRAPFADKLVGAYLFGQPGYVWDLVGGERGSTPLGTAVQAPAPFGLGVQTLTGAGFVTPNPPPYVASFACGGYLPEANVTGLVIGAGLDQWSMAVFNWAAFVNAGTWRFGCGVQGSVGSGTPAPVGRFDVGMAKDPTTALPNAWCYVDGVQVVTSDTPNGTSAIYPLRSRITVQTASKAILDYLLMFSVRLPDWAFREIKRNPYQYFQTPSRSLWSVSSSPATSVSFSGQVGIGASFSLAPASPASSVSLAGAVGVGFAATIAVASPATAVDLGSSVGVGFAATLAPASPATSVSLASSVSVGFAASLASAYPASAVSLASSVGVGFAATLSPASASSSVSLASSVAVGFAASLAATSPATAVGAISSVGVGFSATLSPSHPSGSVAMASAVAIGFGATLAVSSPGTASWEFALARIRAFRNPPA